MTEKKRFWIYIAVSFGGGWLCMALGMLLGGALYQPLVALAMFMPMLGVLLAHGGLKRDRTGIRWELRVRGRGRWYLLAWLGPAALTIVCAALFFALFPSRFDPALDSLTAQLPAGTELPLTPQALAAVSFVQAITNAPLLNMLLAVGEESGWRGYMTPYLTARFGRTKGFVLAGCLWAVWHWPLILCAGYEFGAGYPGAPYTGMLLMCVGCTAVGILLTFLYERAGSIWAPALAHGALNAAAGLGLLFLAPGITSYFPGPTPFGLVAGIPLYLLAGLVLSRPKNNSQEENE